MRSQIMFFDSHLILSHIIIEHFQSSTKKNFFMKFINSLLISIIVNIVSTFKSTIIFYNLMRFSINVFKKQFQKKLN